MRASATSPFKPRAPKADANPFRSKGDVDAAYFCDRER
jgi:hypothetical protein